MSHSPPPKSGKQRRVEIMAERARKRRHVHQRTSQVVWQELMQQATTAQERQALRQRAEQEGLNVIPANQHVLAAHNNTYGELPSFYIDQPFVCRTCGAHAVWTAQQQQWWFEQAGGHIDSQAVECSSCRAQRRATGDAQTDPALALRYQAQYLRSLHNRSSAHSTEAQADVLAALCSKWHGIRVVALGVIGSWWGCTRHSRWLDILHEHILLLDQTGDDEGLSYRSTSTWGYIAATTSLKAIGSHIQPQDVEQELSWLLTHCSATLGNLFAYYLEQATRYKLLTLLREPSWWQAAHQQPAVARKLSWLLSAISPHLAYTPQWQELARHYLASPCIQPAPTWLQRQLEYAITAAQPPSPSGRKKKTTTRRPGTRH